ncbi:MAG: homocysteine S-methyltransferase family protein [Ignavibacteriales bacterium]|nr:homocysteine S-methyltransferase family protein [Ignavibacteriales bacterium]
MTIEDVLRKRRPVLFDGANGTEYQRRGLVAGLAPESWNLSNAQAVEEVHREYCMSGSQVIESNTFGANRKRLESSGLENKIKEINKIAVGLALSAADEKVLVAGSVGPLGALVDPYGDVRKEEAGDIFREQVELLIGAGVHLIAIETMISLEEAVIALEAAKDAGAKTVSVTMTFEPSPDGPRTPFGESPTQAVELLERYGVSIIGSNCGRGFDVMRAVAKEMKMAAKVPVLIQPNAGIPEYLQNAVTYPESPQQFGEFVKEMTSLGVELIGGCCGMTSAHIAEAHRVIQRMRKEKSAKV